MRPASSARGTCSSVFDVAEAVGARVILVGDRRQHRSVTAGEPLKLLEEKAGLPVAEVTEILRQQGDYKKAAEALSEGRTEEAFEELDKLGWIKQVADADRYKQLAAAYLAAVAEKKKDGKPKSALVVSPTHAEADRITQAIRAGLKAQASSARNASSTLGSDPPDGRPESGPDRIRAGRPAPVPPERTGLQERIAPDRGRGSQAADRAGQAVRGVPADAVRPGVGDRVRITAGGKTKDGKHRLSNGSLLTVQGFTKRGDIIVDHGWVIDRDFGHLTHGYVVTSHASQGVTVDKVFVGMSSESFPATYQRTAYVAVTRGQGTGADFHGRQERTAQGGQPAGRSNVGDGTFRIAAAATRHCRIGLTKRLALRRGFSVFDRRQTFDAAGTRQTSH